MRSSAGVIDAERRSATALAAVALAALALSLVLAFVSTLHRQPAPAVQRTAAVAPAATPAVATTAVPTAAPTPAVAVAEPVTDRKPQPLWELLAPWALAADVVAGLGLAAVLAVRYAARRRGARS